MMNPEALKMVVDNINSVLSEFIMPLLALFALTYLFIAKLLLAWIKNNGIVKGLYLLALALVPVFVWVGIFWFVTALFEKHTEFLRWIILWTTFLFIIYFLSKKFGEGRGIKSGLYHLIILSLGWYFGKWFGILFISTPILVAYYNTMRHLAYGVVPSSSPEDKKERWQRFLVLFWYTWGLQHPIQVVSDKNPSSRNVETRIEGSPFSAFSKPGIIWIKSHQAAALTVNINFSRVEGPRVIFTKPYEQLLEVVDLRTHLRRSTIDAVTKDGVRFKAVVFASFSLDHDEWSVETYSQLFHKKPLLLHGRKLDANTDGIYPFSRPRVRSALMMRGKTSTTPEEQTTVNWDDRVINHIEVAASHILSDRRFDELWHPVNDGPGISALDEIADGLKERVAFDLLAQGVRLYAARVVAFDFSEYKVSEHEGFEQADSEHKKSDDTYDEVIKQQIESWRVDWESQKSQILTNADAESSRLQQEARAYVQSAFLTAIAEGLQQTHIRYPNLPRHVIAMHFMGALEQIVRNQPEALENESEDVQANVTKLRSRIAETRAHYL